MLLGPYLLPHPHFLISHHVYLHLINQVIIFTFCAAIEGLELNPKGDCSRETCHHVIAGIYAVWWSKEKEGQAHWADKAVEVGQILSEQRLDLMQNFSLPVSEILTLLPIDLDLIIRVFRILPMLTRVSM